MNVGSGLALTETITGLVQKNAAQSITTWTAGYGEFKADFTRELIMKKSKFT